MKGEFITVRKEALERIVRDIERLSEELEILLNPDWNKAIEEALEDVEKDNIISRKELEEHWKEEHV